jgi:hypothetical protein
MEQWNIGMMEKCNNSKTETPLTNASFHYSTIPVFASRVRNIGLHYVTDSDPLDTRHSVLGNLNPDT